jgi:hypothetical protein
VKAAFSSGHSVQTVTEAGWRGRKDGPLLKWAQNQFDVFVTIDRNIPHQQNLKQFRLGFVIVRVRSNELKHYMPLFDNIQQAAESVRRGQAIEVPANLG